ncbi:hypothetical protein SFUMM280S_04443 [Streptomyces fumanus]
MLRLGRREFAAHEPVIMAIVNRTPDSFYDQGATFHDEPALARVERAVAEGAAIIDVGGVKAGPGDEVSAEEEARRTVGFVAEVRRRFPDVVISVDTWRHEVGEAVCEAGADLLNDAWGGVDPRLAEVAARYGAGLVCTHAGGAEPRTRPHRVTYDDVMADILEVTLGLAERAVSLGVPRESVLIDPGHDFGKNTRHSLEATRRLGEMVDTGWPVLVSLSNKDFVGETLDKPVKERVLGTLATTAVSAWLGAQVYRVHEVAETRQVLDMVAAIAGHRPPRWPGGDWPSGGSASGLLRDQGDRLVHVVGQVEQQQVLLGRLALRDQGVLQPVDESAPVLGAEQDDREAGHLLGLHQGEGLEELVQGAEAAGQDHEALRVLDEHHLPDEEVPEEAKPTPPVPVCPRWPCSRSPVTWRCSTSPGAGAPLHGVAARDGGAPTSSRRSRR